MRCPAWLGFHDEIKINRGQGAIEKKVRYLTQTFKDLLIDGISFAAYEKVQKWKKRVFHSNNIIDKFSIINEKL